MQFKLGNRTISLFEERKSPENALIEKRSNSVSSALSQFNQWLIPSNNAGVNVNPQSALQISTLWACVNLIAKDVSRLPVFVQEDDTHKVDYSHPVMKLLGPKGRANDLMTPLAFTNSMLTNAALRGNAFAKIVRDKNYKPISLEPIPFGGVVVLTNSVGPINALKYVIMTSGEEVMPEDMLHFRGLTMDGVRGLSPVVYGQQVMGIAMASDSTAGQAFGAGSSIAGFISVSGDLDDESYKRMVDGIRTTWAGIQSGGGIGLLPNGADFKKVMLTPAEYQLLEARKFNVQDICRWFNMPPSMVGDNGGTAYASNEQEMQKYVNECLSFWVDNIEQEIKSKLLTEEERQYLDINIPMTALLRGDTQARTTYYKEMINMGAMTPNTAAIMEGLPPVEGGDNIRVQINTIPVELLPDYYGSMIERNKASAPTNNINGSN